MAYEVWDRFNMSPGKSLPAAIHYTIDVAIETAKKLSRGTHRAKYWKPKNATKNNPYNMWDGEYVDIDAPNAFCIVERNGGTNIKGWAFDGVFSFACDCKRCNNTGDNGLGLPCPSCRGASLKPNI
jgi:hypothetical protein